MGGQAAADDEVFKKNEKRNALEAYVLQTKSKLETEWAAFVTAEVKASFITALDEAEERLYSDDGRPHPAPFRSKETLSGGDEMLSVSTVCAGYDADYPTLSSRFSALAKVGDPLEERCNESHRRPEALDNARTLVREVRASADEMEVRHHRLQTMFVLTELSRRPVRCAAGQGLGDGGVRSPGEEEGQGAGGMAVGG